MLREAPDLLIEEEYRARKRWGDDPPHAIYFDRFGDRSGDVESSLHRIDHELQRETWEEVVCRPLHQSLVVQDHSLPHFDYADFLLNEMIGFGHMGRVYVASNRADGRAVAVKFLRKTFCTDVVAVSRFLREAQMVHGLNHPGIARVEGVGSTLNGGHFLVMELLKGPDLASVIEQGPVEISSALKWTVQAAKAIAFANAAGIFHCDLKPGNLVLDSEKNVKVTDFGLATSVNDQTYSLTRIAGTAPFMAPEQVSAWWGQIGPHTDVYGLGAVLFTLLTGRPPYVGSCAVDILSKVVSGEEPPRPELLRPGINATLSRVVAKALSKNSGERFKSAIDFATDLESCGGSVSGD
jgi:serine/threonine protein kinase